MKTTQNNNNNNKNKYNRNKSFGSGGTGAPNSPKKKGNQPARRSVSHDGSKLKLDDDNDGFTTIATGTKKKGAAGRFQNENNRNNNNNTPRGRMNPTSSFTRPRSSQSFNKPRPTGSFKKGRDNNNNRNNMNGNVHDHRRTRSFNKPRPTGSFNANHNNTTAAAKRELYHRSTSRLTAYDVELYTQGDGKSQPQRSVTRIHVDVLMRARLSHLDPPAFGPEDTTNDPKADTWNPHHKCLWNDPTRPEQIEQVMQQYPNAIPLHLKKRTRIKSSKLGDSLVSTSSGASIVSEASDLGDDSSLGGGMSIISGSGETLGDASCYTFGQEDMNPLRKTLMLLNKLSWTTIDKLTPKLFEVLEQDIPNLIAPPTPLVIKTGDGGADQDHSDHSEGNSNIDASKKDNNNKATTELSPMVITILTLIVEKAQTEPHFSAMYAQLCKNMAERNMAWRKKILAHCQLEFEHDIAWHTTRLDERLEEKANRTTAPMDDNSSSSTASEDMDRDYQVLQLRKGYLGHVQFIGELFKLGLIKLDIMIWCLSRLLFNKEEVDEDDLECFVKLMTVVGEQAEALVKKGKCHAVAEEKWFQCWDRVYWLTGRTKKTKRQQQQEQKQNSEPPPKVSSRIRFMLVDLLELEENGWVARREQEKPKTITEIHEEVREEEEEARRRSYSDDFSGSFGGSRRRTNSHDGSSSFGHRRRTNSNDGSSSFGHQRRRGNRSDYSLSPGSDKPRKVVDADGFIEISNKSSAVRRAVSMDVSEIYNKQNNKKQPVPVPTSPTSRPRTALSQIDAANATPKIVEYPDPQHCKDKAKTILKEYFVGGDTQDAILSIDELVMAGRDNDDHGSVERGAAVIESGILLVMEMKQQEVQKFLAVIKRCLQNKKIEKASLPLGLKDPLEFLSDIEIDAPLARALLTSIVAYWVRQDALPFNFLLDAPEYFRTDGKAAEFAAGVLKVRGDNPSEEDLVVVEKLMTEDDKKEFSSAKEMLGPQA